MTKLSLKLSKETLVTLGISFAAFNMCKTLIVDFGASHHMITDIRI